MLRAISTLALEPTMPAIPHIAGSLTRLRKRCTASVTSHRAAVRLGCVLELQRPWQHPPINDLAMQKTVALRTHIEERVKLGDATYSDSLELMIFLANLVGSEHIERFIPLADPESERSLTPEPADDAAPASDTATREMPKLPAAKPTPLDDSARAPTVSVTATREMPKFLAAKRAPPPSG